MPFRQLTPELFPSAAAKIGILAKIRAGILAALFRLGRQGGVRRLFEVASEIDRHLDEALGDQPFWYLNNMVVRESLRGSGIGTRLLREQLQIVTEKDPTSAVALLTQRTENVVFYQRLGFRVALDQIIGSAPGAFRNWIMVYAR